MTSYDTDLLVVGGGPGGLATALHARARGLSVIVAEPRENPIDKACGEGLMPGGLAELTSLGVDPVGLPFHGIAYVGEHRRVQARFRTGPGRGVRRTTLHAALAARAKEQDTEWIRSRVATIQHVAMYGYAAASASASRLIPFAAPPKTTNSAGVVAQAVASVSWPNPNDWWLVRLLGSITPTERTTIVRLLGQSYLATGMARFLTSIAQQLTFGPGGTTAGSGGAWYPTPQFAGLGAGPAVSASLARAEPVGRLSVPPSWAVAAPAFAEKPEAGTPMSVIGEASSCGQGGLLRGIPLARAGRRTGAFAHRYGFRHSVITRSPSAG
ncbi:PPE family protein, SVP subgroup [Mycobacterium tuberculosis]|uniref:PPE family protein, SVP subgroup n=1 Tax=Mycobacterium tuberculosis TaxID=1773 RepID=UPI002729ECDA|nr:FAD-binding protein [Mycobacterium tuberculosis]